MNEIIFSESFVIDLGTRVSLDTCLGSLWIKNLWKDLKKLFLLSMGVKSTLGLK